MISSDSDEEADEEDSFEGMMEEILPDAGNIPSFDAEDAEEIKASSYAGDGEIFQEDFFTFEEEELEREEDDDDCLEDDDF